MKDYSFPRARLTPGSVVCLDFLEDDMVCSVRHVANFVNLAYSSFGNALPFRHGTQETRATRVISGWIAKHVRSHAVRYWERNMR